MCDEIEAVAWAVEWIKAETSIAETGLTVNTSRQQTGTMMGADSGNISLYLRPSDDDC